MKVVLKAVGDGSFNVYKDGVLYAKELIHSEAIIVRKSLLDDTAMDLIPLEPEKQVRDYGQVA
jgi:hypothetical protein